MDDKSMKATLECFFSPIEEVRAEDPTFGTHVYYDQHEASPVKTKENISEAFMAKNSMNILEEGSKRHYQTTIVWRSAEIPTTTGLEFEMFCELAGVVVSGKGNTKKLAKQRAATNYLYEVVKKGLRKEFCIPGETDEEANENIRLQAEKVDGVKLNPSASMDADEEMDDGTIPTCNKIPVEVAHVNWVGKLNETLTKHKLEVASYAFDESGSDNKKRFTATCFISSQKTRGIANQKKMAKTFAAFLMCEILEKGIQNMDNELFMDSDLEEDEEVRQVENPVRTKCLQDENAERSLNILLSDTAIFSSYEMKFKDPPPKAMSEKQAILTVIVTIVPPPEPEELEVGAEHTQTDEIAKQSALRDRERKKILDGGPFVFAGRGKDQETANNNACQSALIHFHTYTCLN